MVPPNQRGWSSPYPQHPSRGGCPHGPDALDSPNPATVASIRLGWPDRLIAR